MQSLCGVLDWKSFKPLKHFMFVCELAQLYTFKEFFSNLLWFMLDKALASIH